MGEFVSGLRHPPKAEQVNFTGLLRIAGLHKKC